VRVTNITSVEGASESGAALQDLVTGFFEYDDLEKTGALPLPSSNRRR
jgi:hypothetical protein